jgi:hypothetical protein
MNLYEFGSSSPVTYGDPLGLYVDTTSFSDDIFCYAQQLEVRQRMMQRLPPLIWGQMGPLYSLSQLLNWLINNIPANLSFSGALNLAFAMPNVIAKIMPLLQNVDLLSLSANFFAGLGDIISFGITRDIRKSLGWNDVVDTNSWAYTTGKIGGYIWWTVLTAKIGALAYQKYLALPKPGYYGGYYFGSYPLQKMQARGISIKGALDAIQDAYLVISKYGKYGQLQKAYWGYSGITTIVERGYKIVTVYPGIKGVKLPLPKFFPRLW